MRIDTMYSAPVIQYGRRVRGGRILAICRPWGDEPDREAQHTIRIDTSIEPEERHTQCARELAARFGLTVKEPGSRRGYNGGWRFEAV